MPTYNEVENIEPLLYGIADAVDASPSTSFSVTIVDDNSPDGTGQLVQRLISSINRPNLEMRLVVKPTREGLGAAYLVGFRAAMDDIAVNYVLQMDADLSHDPAYIGGFIAHARQGTDFVVASRYIPGGGTPDWTWNRRVLSRGGNFYARAILGRRISDYTGGFNMYSREVLQRVDIPSVTAPGYGYVLMLKWRAIRTARSYAEIPLIFHDRTRGASKIPRNTVIRSLLLVPKLKFRGY